MNGNTNIREVKKYEYDLKASDISFVSDAEGIYQINSTMNLDSMTPITVTDGGGGYI